MKICPQCNTEYEDFYEFCSKDNSPLKSVSEDNAVNEIVGSDESANSDVSIETPDAASDKSDFVSGDGEKVVDEEFEASQEEIKDEPVRTAAASASNNSGALPKFLALIVILVAIGAGLMLWKRSVGTHHGSAENISKEEMELILQDVNPMMLRQLSQNPEAKKELADNVAELFAVASQAEKEGLAANVDVKRELDNFETEILATSYDKAINKDKDGPMPPFGFISEERVQQFWNGSDAQPGVLDKIGMGGSSPEAREKEFEKFLESKINIFKENSPGGNVPEITEEQKKQARDFFAKTRIYAAEAKAKEGVANNGLPEDFFRKVELQTKLQRAQFLARMYSQKVLTKKLEVTDEDVQKYIEAHPELGSKEEKKAKAQEILNRVKAGEDFAALAKEYSEDPGSKDKGGLYEGVTEGAFVPEFETTAFSLEPGQIAPELVESNFGYHIIKLEKKGETKGQDGQAKRTFDARHILISTMFKDPENPMAREQPVKDYVKAKLEKEREEEILKEIKANNPVEVAQNFEIPNPPATDQPQLPPGMTMEPPDDMPSAEVDKPEGRKEAPKGKQTKPESNKK